MVPWSKLNRLTTTVLAGFAVLAGALFAGVAAAEAQPAWLENLLGADVWPVACDGCTWNKSFHTAATLEQPWTVSSVVWSSDGRYLIVGSAGEGIISVYDTGNWKRISDIWRWDIAASQPIARFDDQNRTLILPRIWGKNSPIMAPTVDDSVSLEKWDIKRGIIAQKYYAHFPEENTQTFGWRRSASIARAVDVSSEGRLVAAGVAGPPSGVIIYDASSTRIIQDIACGPRNVPEALAFNPDGKTIAVAGCHLHQVSVYDTASGSMKYQTVVDQEAEVYNAISYNPSGSLIAVGSSSGDHGIVTILNAADGSTAGILTKIPPEPYAMHGYHATITNLQWIDNDVILASYDDHNVDGSVARLWDTRTMQMVGEIGGNQLNIVAISPDQTRLAAAIGKNVIVGTLQ